MRINVKASLAATAEYERFMAEFFFVEGLKEAMEAWRSVNADKKYRKLKRRLMSYGKRKRMTHD